MSTSILMLCLLLIFTSLYLPCLLSAEEMNGGHDNGNEVNYEDTIRRMKILSKAQTTFLKVSNSLVLHDPSQAYLSTKLELAKDLVMTATESLSKFDDDLAFNLKKDLKKLKLDEIRVDFSAAELMMQEEMELLRNSIDGGAIATSAAGGGGGSTEKDIAKIKQLETENVNLRGLLKDLKAELLNAGKKSENGSPATPTAAAPSTVVEVDSPALLAEVEKLRSQLGQANQELADKTRELNSLSNDSKSRESSTQELQKEIKNLRTELENVNATASSATEDSTALRRQIKDLQAELDKEKASSSKKLTKAQTLATELESKLAESQNKAEKEKEELMEAMAQEVEVSPSSLCSPLLRSDASQTLRKWRRSMLQRLLLPLQHMRKK
jgi:chromosome segregation ATPase